MRPIRLELRGFTAFRNETAVDFEGRRLFAITGATGAGKSSLLDAITWALYGEVPRVGRETRQLMSHGAITMSVLFEFSAHGNTYRVSRQAGKSSAVRLEQQTAGNWKPVTDRVRDTAAEIERIIGLDYDTFTKTVLLPQGAFDAFLRGDPKERRDILSGLLGLSVYEQMREAAQARVIGARNRADEQRQQAERLADSTPEAIAALDAEHATQAGHIEKVREQRVRLAALAALERTASEQAREAANASGAATVAVRTRDQATEALAAAEAALHRAAAAITVIETERGALGYDATVHRALQQQAAQIRQYEQARGDLDAAERAHRETFDATATARATEARAKQEAAALHDQATTAENALAIASANVASTAGRALAVVAVLRATQERLTRDRAAAQHAAAEAAEQVHTLDALAVQVEQTTADLARADAEHQRALAEAASVEAERVAAEAAVTTTAAAHADALAARDLAIREDAAAALRRDLKVGDPCPVCGEPITALTEHAAPDLDAAFAAAEAAELALQEARATHEALIQRASAAHARVDSAHATLDAVTERIAGLDAACAANGTARAGLSEAQSAARATLAATGEAAATAERGAVQAAERERAVALLLATVPAEISPTPLASGADLQDTDHEDGAVETLLGEALAALAAATASRWTALDALRSADEAARTASVAVTHAQEREEAALEATVAARTRLNALAGPAAEDAASILADLELADQRAARNAELEQLLRAAEQTRAAETSRLEERRQAVAAAAGEAERVTSASDAAARAAAAAAEAYAERWRELKDVSDAPNAETLTAMGHRLEQAEVQAATALAVLDTRVEQARAARVEAQRLRSEAAKHERTMAVATALERDLHRNNFIAFVQREAMQVLADEAADRMEHLSRGRYRMRADGDEFVVIDRLNGDDQRSVKTLSGGETFLASLALALALAERLPSLAGHGGAIALESLFLDEGFGSLDSDALDVAIEALEMLASDNRMIGVISHVPLIAERLPDRIEVVRLAGGSTVRG